jgi:hypothetical protein
MGDDEVIEPVRRGHQGIRADFHVLATRVQPTGRDLDLLGLDRRPGVFRPIL